MSSRQKCRKLPRSQLLHRRRPGPPVGEERHAQCGLYLPRSRVKAGSILRVFPIEAVKTNVLGTENVLTAAIDEGVESVICLSTDKAAYPVNAMGTSKAMMEKVIVGKSRTTTKTKICCTRYGNVMCSRGSVIPLWIDQIREGNPITITDGTMTRFIMSLDEAVDLVLFAV